MCLTARNANCERDSLVTLIVPPSFASTHFPPMYACVRTSDGSLRPNYRAPRQPYNLQTPDCTCTYGGSRRHPVSEERVSGHEPSPEAGRNKSRVESESEGHRAGAGRGIKQRRGVNSPRGVGGAQSRALVRENVTV